jgi:uncharacterized protein YaeQ
MLFRFEINFADVDRGVYEDHDLRVAQHRSEDAPRLLTRVLAFVLEHKEGLVFGKGLSDGDEASLWVKTLDGRVTDWIDVGAPAPDRLHRASKLAERVAVYAHRRPELLQQRCQKERIHKADQIRLVTVPDELLTFLGERLDRNNRWDISVTEGVTTVVSGNDVCECTFTTQPLVP